MARVFRHFHRLAKKELFFMRRLVSRSVSEREAGASTSLSPQPLIQITPSSKTRIVFCKLQNALFIVKLSFETFDHRLKRSANSNRFDQSQMHNPQFYGEDDV
jgi:hypothetical protein